MNSDPKNLLNQARKARERAVAPYSGFRVGAALATRSGAIYPGCNIENASYGLTMCAERVALYSALAQGEREFDAIAVVAESGEPVPPCGPCRQLLWEFCGDIPLISGNTAGETRQRAMSELLPDPFELDPKRNR